MTHATKVIITALSCIAVTGLFVAFAYYTSPDVTTIEIVPYDKVEYLHKNMWRTEVYVIEAECQRYYVSATKSHRDVFIKFRTNWGTEYGASIWMPKRAKDQLMYIQENIKDRRSLKPIEQWHELWIE